MLSHDSGHQVTVPAPPSVPSFLVLQASVAQILILCEQGEGEESQVRRERRSCSPQRVPHLSFKSGVLIINGPLHSNY